FHSNFTDLSLSSIVAISEKVKRLESEEGKRIIKFQRGDLNINTPEYVKEAIKKSLDAGRTNYPKSGGEPNFKQATKKYHAESGITLDTKDIVCLHGGQEGLQLSFGLFRGKKALGFSPYWPCLTGNIFPYTEIDFKTIDLEETNGKISFDANKLEDKLKQVDIFYHNSPHNPTGKVFTPEETKITDELAKKHGVIIISDEPYDKIVYDNIKHTSMLEFENENTITVLSGSKSFASTGLRVGHIICRNNNITKLLTRANYSQTAGVATFIQDAYTIALTDTENREAWFNELKTELQKRRNVLYQELHQVFPNLTKPEGAFYTFPDCNDFIPKGTRDKDRHLIDLFMKEGVAIVPGGTFGKPGYMRISFSATSVEETSAGGRKIAETIRKQRAT
ncbi:MAG: pyridoxal phosphate-dependent aminotransferase, partial [Candidatus Nanoarchaeia archaeon]